MVETVCYESGDGVAIVTIDRPEVRNAMDLGVFAGLYEAGVRAAADPAVRAVVVAGAGGTFSSGIDTTLFASAADPVGFDIAALQRAVSVYEEIPKPTVAAVGGPAFGAGLQLALACDLRIVADDVALSVMEVRWGLVPDLGGTQRLPRLVGLGRAKELAMTGRRVGSQEACAIGLATRSVAPAGLLPEALALARELAGGPPLALAAIKRLANGAFDVPVRAGLGREAASQRRILASADFPEAVTARMQKRAPRFENR